MLARNRDILIRQKKYPCIWVQTLEPEYAQNDRVNVRTFSNTEQRRSSIQRPRHKELPITGSVFGSNDYPVACGQPQTTGKKQKLGLDI